ncbi:MAG: hypothetical protein PUG68_07470 [Lachnospiraceae bacterium]|jgi:hypothetical protein|nr:hypothetical protein [Lachnospiraceae bacterium]MDY2759316.1 hypothetical protein [Lachnospiraceae bacterium]
MSIRPVEFNGMIQNTQGASIQKAADDSRPAINQQNMAVTVTKEAEQAQRSVTKKSESAKESALDPNGSNGGALLSDEKRERKQKKKDEDSDGRVIRKGEAVSFDIKI